MNKLKNIVVGVDFSDCSRCALEQAVRLARWNSARLHVIHAIESLVITEAAEALHLSIEKMQADTVRQAGDRLQTWIGEVGAAAETSVVVSVGPPIETLLSTLRSVRADLLVLGATGDSLLPSGAGTLACAKRRRKSCW